jgi:hypothetical protein
VLVAGVARNVPLDAAGKIGPEFQQSTAMLRVHDQSGDQRVARESSVCRGERTQILGELRTAPRLFSNRSGYINQIIALDNVVEGLKARNMRNSTIPR